MWCPRISCVLRSRRCGAAANIRRVPFFMAKSSPADLGFLQDLVVQGKLRPAIERHYPLSEVVAALRYVGSGQARAKLIIDVA